MLDIHILWVLPLWILGLTFYKDRRDAKKSEIISRTEKGSRHIVAEGQTDGSERVVEQGCQ